MFGLPKIRFTTGYKSIKIYLPWRVEGHDGHPHQATLEVDYSNTQIEETFESGRNYRTKEREIEERTFIKKVKSGLRRCPGHKGVMTPLANGTQCSRCGGWVY